MMIEKKGVRQNLDKINVLIEDTDPNSLYFNMTVPNILASGKTAISIDPPPSLLKLSSQVKVELVDDGGNPLYIEFPNEPFVPAYEHGYTEDGSTARLIGITVYPSQQYDYATLYVVGEALKIMPMGIPVPKQWQGVYNVRWKKRILLNRNARNESKVIFYNTPQVVVSEIQKPYLNQVYSAGRVVTINNPSYKVRYNAGYDTAVVTAVGFTFTQEMVGGQLIVASPQAHVSYAADRYANYGQYVTYIDSLINNTQAYVRDAYYATQKPGSGHLSPTDAKKYLSVKYFGDSDFTLSYNAAPVYTTSPNLKSFAKFNITELDTFSGDVYKVKVYQGSQGTMGGYKLVAERNLENTELLFNHDAVDPTHQYMGVFVGTQIFNSYWASSSFDFYSELPSAVQPTLTFDSNTLMNGMIISSSAPWDTTNGKVVQFLFPTTQSYFNKGDQLQLSFKLANLSGDGQLDFYASGTAFYQNPGRLEKLWDNGRSGNGLLFRLIGEGYGGFGRYANEKFGKSLLSFNPTAIGQYKTEKKLYGLITVPIQSDFSGSGSINIAVQGGQWVISDISFNYVKETNFSPSAFTFSIPLEPEQEGDAVSFGIKYYNSVGTEVVIPKTPSPNAVPNMTLGQWVSQENYGEYGDGVGYAKKVTGPNTYIDGTRNVMSGSLWIGSNVGHYRYGEIIASGGMEFSADAAPGPSGSIGKGVLMRSLGYEGMWRASHGFGAPGFLIWSGSILPDSGDNYSGAGIEFWGSGSSFHFDTTSGILSITGSINATSGTIGGWKILPTELVSWPGQNLSLSGSGAGYIIARDKNMIDRVFFGVTPDTVTGSDGWRDPTSVQGPEIITDPSFATATPGTGQQNWATGWVFNTALAYITGSGGHTGTNVLYWENDESVTPYTISLCELTASSITAGALYTFACWHKGLSSRTVVNNAYMNVYQKQGASYVLVATGDMTLTTDWSRHILTYNTPAGSDGTGSMYFDVIFAGEEKGGDVLFDDFSVRTYTYFTDVSQNGLFIFSSPTSYIKLGAAGVGLTALTEITASNIRVYQNIDMDGILYPDKGVGLQSTSTSSIRWAGGLGTDYYATYFDPTSSNRGGEVDWDLNDRTNTDYNVYSRMGGGGGASKNRGWAFSDSSYLGHATAVQILVGSDTPLIFGKDIGAIYVKGFIHTQNAQYPNRMAKLLVTGSRYSYFGTPTNIAPSFQFVDGNQAAGKVLTSDASGFASWQTAMGGGGGGYWVTSSDGKTIYPMDGGLWVAIGRTGASASLDVTGSFRYTDGNEGSGKVLTSDTNGYASWATPTGGSGGGAGISWIYTETDVTMSANMGYITSGTNITLCLPSGSQTGSIFEVVGRAGTWKITPNSEPATQMIYFGYMTASVNPIGYLSSSLARDTIRLVCVSASYEFNVVSAVGNIEIV
jgi:hypothetical protein